METKWIGSLAEAARQIWLDKHTDLIKTHVLDLSLVWRKLQRIMETGQSAIYTALWTDGEIWSERFCQTYFKPAVHTPLAVGHDPEKTWRGMSWDRPPTFSAG